MLKSEENELLCRVGPGTPMGAYMRQFWIPALRSARLTPGGAPVRVRLLGENFVAFRASDGRVGFFDEACPHRGASMALAHNEGDGLRCSYHGLKLGPAGEVLDMPCERPERRAEYAGKLAPAHYPAREAGTVIWVHIGRPANLPEFPDFNFFKLPDRHIQSAVGVIHCNWLQGLEGQLDSAHVAILHRDWIDPENAPRGSGPQAAIRNDTGPRFEFDPQPYGYREAAVRRAPGDRHYVRVRDFVVPWYSFIPIGGPEHDHCMTVSVPVDDEHSAQWDVVYNFVHPMRQENLAGGWDDPNNMAAGLSTKVEERFGQNRVRMKEGSWTGVAKLRFEDFTVAMGQGRIVNRSREYLGMSDTSINRARRLLLDAVRKFERGETAFGTTAGIRWEQIKAESAIIPADADWRSVAR
jgi:phthalate 4,5-dioxygenase oxygenase subunit